MKSTHTRKKPIQRALALALTVAMTFSLFIFNVSADPAEQTNPILLSEGFESGSLPDGWTKKDVGTYDWVIGTGDDNTNTGSHTGVKNAVAKSGSGSGNPTLVSPSLNLASLNDVTLSFWYINRAWSGDIDEFTVYYIVVGNDDWVELFHTDEEHSTWTNQIISLPEGALVNGVQIAFEMTVEYGHGVGLDDVYVYLPDALTPHTLSFDGNRGTGEMLSVSLNSLSPFCLPTCDFAAPENEYFVGWNTAEDGEGTSYSAGDYITLNSDLILYAQWTPAFSITYDANFDDNGGTGTMENTVYTGSAVTVSNNSFVASSSKSFYCWNTSQDGTGTVYWPGDSITLDQNIVLYAQWVGMPKELDEGFERGEMPWGWSVEAEGANAWSIGVGDYDDSFGTHTGYYNAKVGTSTASYTDTWLISPELDLTCADSSQVLSFWYINRNWDGYIDSFGVSYRINGGEWQELFYTEEAHDVWTKEVIVLPVSALTSGVQIGFKRTDKYGFGAGLDDVLLKLVPNADMCTLSFNANDGNGEMQDVIFSNEGAVVIPENAFTAPSNQMFFARWNTRADGTGTTYRPGDSVVLPESVTLYAQWTNPYVVRYDANGGVGDTFNTTYVGKPLTVLSNSFTGKDGLYFYKWNTKPDGTGTSYWPGDKIEPTEYTTLYAQWCVFYENFDGSNNLDDWTFIDADGDGYNWFVWNTEDQFDTMYFRSSPSLLTSASYSNSAARTPDNWAITPAINIPEHAHLSFWLLAQDVRYPGDKVAVYIGDSPEIDSMTQISPDYITDDRYLPYEIDLSDYVGEKYIAFRHYDCTDFFRVNIDDVSVSAHIHGDLTYEADGNVITALCGNPGCDINTGWKLIVREPAEGSNEVTFNQYDSNVFPDVVVEYSGRNGTTYTSSTTAPTLPGDYTASVTIEGAKATLDYSLECDLPTFGNRSLVLSGQIGLNFFMKIPDAFTDGTMTFTISGGTSNRTEQVAGELQADGRYLFTCYVNSIEMADEITAVYTYTADGQERTVSMTTSVKEYLDTLLGDSETYADESPLAKALYNYGYFAQQSLPGGAKHAQMPDTYVDDMQFVSELSEYPVVANINRSVITGATFSLELESETAINFYLTTDLELSTENVTVEGDVETEFDYTVEKVGSRYRVQITEIGAHELGDEFTVSIPSANSTISASALSYVQMHLANTNPQIATEASKKTAAALYAYYLTAIDYAGLN